jgi:TolA-binding protein
MKYIKDILIEFDRKHRMKVLILLLVFLVVVILGQKYLEIQNPELKKLKEDNKEQQSQIDSLNVKIIRLNRVIISNQEQCTNSMVQREEEILRMIAELQVKANIHKESIRFNEVKKDNGGGDGDVVAMMPVPQPIVVEDKTYENGLKVISNKLKKHIKENRK